MCPSDCRALTALPSPEALRAPATVRRPQHEDANSRLTSVSEHSASLPVRFPAFTRAARREGLQADLIDAHFALYALLPLLSRRLRNKPRSCTREPGYLPPAVELVLRGGQSCLAVQFRPRGRDGPVWRPAGRSADTCGPIRPLPVLRGRQCEAVPDQLPRPASSRRGRPSPIRHRRALLGRSCCFRG
jgi:hypothetical protein